MSRSFIRMFSLSTAAAVVSAAVVLGNHKAAYAISDDEVLQLDQLCGGRGICQPLVSLANKIVPNAQSGELGNRVERFDFLFDGTHFVMDNTMVEQVGSSDPAWDQLSGASDDFPESGTIRFSLKGFYQQPNGTAVGQVRTYYGECRDRRTRNYTEAGFSESELESAYEFTAQGHIINAQGRSGMHLPTIEEDVWSYYACYLAYDLPLIQHILLTQQMPVDSTPFYTEPHPMGPSPLDPELQIHSDQMYSY